MSKPNLTPPVLTQADINRFWAYVNKSAGQGPNGDCWEWIRGKNSDRYGNFQANGRQYRASRLAFFLATGQWTELLVRHTCDNPPCCRPDHLIEGTTKDNAEDARERNRLCVGVQSHAAKLTETDVIAIRKLYATTKIGSKRIAKQYGVAHSLIWRILKRKSWSHI